MNSTPQISVLMPVCNAEAYIQDAIDSIVKQSFTDWEAIIIDDGSTDGSERIIKQFNDPRIKYYKNEHNLGLVTTLNKGISLCRGKYIARMDADDISLPDRLKRQYSFMEKNPKTIFCGTNALIINSHNDVTGKIHNLGSNELLQIGLLFTDPFIHPSVIIRKEILEKQLYDNNYKHAEDYELWYRLAKLGDIANIEDELIKYRWHNNNVSQIYQEEQNKMKRMIIRHQLQRLGIEASERDLSVHQHTFGLYQFGHKVETNDIDSTTISSWFRKLLEHNKQKNIYNQLDLKAFLWSRWIVLCSSNKQYTKILNPGFPHYCPIILYKMYYILSSLRKKS